MSTEMVECVECDEEVGKEKAITEVNTFGPGADQRYFCSLGCSMQFAGGGA